MSTIIKVIFEFEFDYDLVVDPCNGVLDEDPDLSGSKGTFERIICPTPTGNGLIQPDLTSTRTDVGMARLRSTLSTAAHRSPMLSAGSVSGQPHSN